MICSPCRDGHHSACDDVPRLDAETMGLIIAATPGAGRWCDCQHQARRAAGVGAS